MMDVQELRSLLPLDAVAPPIRLDEGGAVRVGKGRITLALVVEEYESGMTPEDMVRAYDTLNLADVYGAIAYYLRHRDAVREYMIGDVLKKMGQGFEHEKIGWGKIKSLQTVSGSDVLFVNCAFRFAFG